MKKQPSHTWIEVNNEEHTFIVNDQNHPQMIETFTELETVEIMHDVPAMKFVLHDVQRKNQKKVSDDLVLDLLPVLQYLQNAFRTYMAVNHFATFLQIAFPYAIAQISSHKA